MKKYINCVSLGWYCATACSLGKLGLRSWSGPFDWYFSSFESVIDCINTNFVDFMKEENLYVKEDDEKKFICNRYGFMCIHDIQNSFSDEVEDICQKYKRRALRFIKETKYPTLFFRIVRDVKEIEYIVNNFDYIMSVIKKNNSKNDICFILFNHLPDLPYSLKWFRLPIKNKFDKLIEMRGMFEFSPELKKYAVSVLDNEKVINNTKYDIITNGNRVRFALFTYLIEKNSPIILKKISEKIDIKDDSNIYVWGAGVRGWPLTEYLINNGVKVKAIVDNDVKKQNKESEVPVIPFDEVEKDSKIIISIVNNIVCEEIINQINLGKKNIECILFHELDIDESVIDIFELYSEER